MKKTEKIIKKQEAQQPVPITPTPSFISEAIEESKRTRIEPKQTDDKTLAEGATSEFWRLVKDYIEGTIGALKKKTTQAAIESGYNLELLGFRYVLMDQLENFGKDIINFVEFKRSGYEEVKRKIAEEAKLKQKGRR